MGRRWLLGIQVYCLLNGAPGPRASIQDTGLFTSRAHAGAVRYSMHRICRQAVANRLPAPVLEALLSPGCRGADNPSALDCDRGPDGRMCAIALEHDIGIAESED